MGRARTDTERILARIRHVRPGEHLCAIQNTKRDQLSAAVAFIQGGLERGECLYVADASNPKGILATLRAQGVDVHAACQSGMLTISDKRTYVRNGRFVPDEMIYFLMRQTQAAIKKYSAFRFAGEMTWILGGYATADKLIEYEAKLNDFLHSHKASILCQYLRSNFDDELILNVLRTHPLVIYQQFMTKNPYYIPPREFFSSRSSKLQVDRYLKSLQDHAATKEELRELSLQLLHSQDEERRRIARELHDSTGQKLAGLVMTLASLRSRQQQLRPSLRMVITRLFKLAKHTAKEVNNISYLLHPPMLEEFGLGDALRWYLRGFSTRSGVDVECTISPKLNRLPKEIEIAVFRIVQEALTNICRHSGSKRAQVWLAVHDGELTIEVRDFGHGLHRQALKPIETVGLGIASMRERLQQLGGKLDLRTSAKGTAVRGIIPFRL
jgi:signal transduction histidine kinase